MPGAESEFRRAMAQPEVKKPTVESGDDAEEAQELADLLAQKPSEKAEQLLQRMRESARARDNAKAEKLKAQLKASLDYEDDAQGSPQPVRSAENLMRRVARHNEELDAKAGRANARSLEAYQSAPTEINTPQEVDDDIRDDKEAA